MFHTKMTRRLALSCMAAMVLAACDNQDTSQQSATQNTTAQSSATYRVTFTPPRNAPLNFRGEKGSAIGFEHDLLEEIAKREGISFTYDYKPWPMMWADMDSGNTDVLSSGLSITDERKAKYFMTEPYLETAPVTIVTKDTNIRHFKDLVGKPVSVVAGSGHNKRVNELNNGNTSYAVLVETSWLTVDAIIRNDAVATVGDRVIMGAFVANHPNNGLNVVVDESYPQDSLGFVVNKSKPELLDKLNNGLANMKADGTYQQLRAKWIK